MYKRLMLERGVVLTYWEVERRGFALVRCVIRCGGTVWWYGVMVRCGVRYGMVVRCGYFGEGRSEVWAHVTWVEK